MRLKQIKLSGFKSFVDPTVFHVPGRLVGVVGPNGCGKSNIIDAVRWVLGESKASELRGESMQDVIFSGSSDRKASARASVELVFDNSLGRISGPWGQYAELSVRRVLGRDGQSIYSINQQIVRRRDVHDLFMGTGLGPRAYAIIGQGTISRIIESRPEELRVFLEEAAGVSRYRERRRETEGRLSDTRENLTRVDDILRELTAQISRLEQQAEVAARYRELESDRDARQRMLWLVRRDEASAEQQRVAAQVSATTGDIDSALTRLRRLEADLEGIRTQHYAAGDEVHAAQGRLYDANAEVARLESDIRVVAQTQGQLRERLDSLDEQARRAQAQFDQATGDREAASGRLGAEQERSQTLAAAAARLASAFPDCEQRARDARTALDEARSVEGEATKSIELSAQASRNAQASLAALRNRRERLQAELSSLVEVDAAEVETRRAELAGAEQREADQSQRLEDLQTRWRELDAARAPAQQSLREAEAKLARVEARVTALRQLQQRLESQSKVQPWLAKHGLERLARLSPRLKLEPGWENAFESALRERVNALELSGVNLLAALASDIPPAKVAFFAPAAADTATAGAVPAGLRPLASLAQCAEAAVQSLLADELRHCYAADSIEEALRDSASLPAGGTFITRDGHQISRSLVSFYAADSEGEGQLARLNEIDNLVREQRAQQLLVDEARSLAVRTESGAAQAQSELSALRDAHGREVRTLSALRLAVQGLEQELTRVAGSRERLGAELAEVDAQARGFEQQIDSFNEEFERLDSELAERQQRVEELRAALEDLETAREQAREALRQSEREAAQADFTVRATLAEIERLDSAARTAQLQREAAASERQQIDQRLAQITDVEARQALQGALEAKTVAESGLSASRNRLDELSQQLRLLEEQKLSAEREQEPLRLKLTDLQLQEQAARLGAEQFAAQLAEVGIDEAQEAALREAYGGNTPKPSWLQGEVTRLANAIAALGPVNLAALDELTQSRERQQFLQAQNADLNEAISTLEDAIRKIDRETRELLRETFDSVNAHFGSLFPRLFGGGEAKLILTGDEILDAGVQVMAQPPGKRTTSIHLLSGGEKALTAIALVFAMFQLNPAPFCLLDEVDAPLDDSNTERYAEMVREMAEQTQFLFITHNKIAMEFAEQLIGVTMQERGVSRIVAVDLEAASRMAEAA